MDFQTTSATDCGEIKISCKKLIDKLALLITVLEPCSIRVALFQITSIFSLLHFRLEKWRQMASLGQRRVYMRFQVLLQCVNDCPGT